MLSRYPTADPSQVSQSDEQAMSYIQEVITSLRNIRAEGNIAPGVEIDGLVKTENSHSKQSISHETGKTQIT